MSATVKSAILLVSTLALGVVLGMVGQGFLSRQRARHQEELRTPPGFVDLVEEVIQPRPEQRAAVRARLQVAAVRYDSVITQASARIDLVLDSMKASLAPILDERQRERLARMTRVPDPHRRPPPRGGSPPPPPPRDNASPPPGGEPQGGRQPEAGQAPPRS
jgi:hypothetical protein